MYIMQDSLRLNAALEMPEGAGEKCPVLVILHGFTGHMEERHILEVARAARSVGFATLRADLYGHGHSDGQFCDHTLYKWLTNAMTLIDYARALPFAGNVYLCGHSQGGLTAMLAAGLKRDQISGLLPLSPASMIPEGARRGELLGTKFDPERVPDMLNGWGGLKLGGNYIRVAQTLHVEEAIDAYRGPVLLVHGDADEAVPLRCSTDAAARYQHAELVVVPGDTHCYDHHLEVVTDAVRRWLAAREGK